MGQFSFIKFNQKFMKTLWIKEEYLQQILEERKTIEVRVGYSNIRKLKIGDMLLHEDPDQTAPDIPSDQLLSAIRSLYSPG